MLRLFTQMGMRMSLKKTLKLKTAQFLTIDAGAVVRNMPSSKERKYKNVEITQDFKKIDQKRKIQRYDNIKKRQLLLQKKLSTQAQLLTGPQSQSIKTQLQQLTQIIQQSNKQIEALTEVIDATEATHIVVEGYLKLGILNHIKYLQYLETHEAGHILHPETIKAIENVHYCLNHNLPINRIKLYEIVPEFFEEQIGELDESVQKLIAEKQIFIQDENSTSTVRFFDRMQIGQQQNKVEQIIDEIQQSLYNVSDYCATIMNAHNDLFQKVMQGKTPYRDLQHLRTVLLSDMPINFLPEELALKEDLIKIGQIFDEWRNFRAVKQSQAREYQRRYIQPPIYIKRHPKLLERYNQMMQIVMNPQPLQEQPWLQIGDQTEVIFAKKLEEQLRALVKQKIDPVFIEAMNTDRSKIDKKNLEIEFYNLATNVMENLLALSDKSKQQEEFIQLLPAQKDFQAKQVKKNLISLDHITRMLYLNKKDKNKYNLAFFSKWFGVDKDQLAAALKYVSFLHVKVGKSDIKIEESQVKADILKFQ